MTEPIWYIFLLCAYLVPVALVVNSKRSRGNEKSGWLIGAVLFSWVTLILYYAVVPSVKAQRKVQQAKLNAKREKIKAAYNEKLAKEEALNAESEILEDESESEETDSEQEKS